MARFMIDEIGNVPLAPPDVSQEAAQVVESFIARNPPGNALVIRSNAAREAYGYEVSREAEEAREDVARMQRLVAGAGSFKDRLYGYGNKGPGNVEDRSDQPPYEPPSWLDRPLKEIFKQAADARREREEQKQKEREAFEKLKGS